MEDMYGDGASLYQYLGSNPWTRKDTLGTSWDPFDFVDEFTAEHSASVAAWMNEIGRGLNGAGLIAASIVSYLPFPGAALVGDLAAAILNGEELSDVLLGHALGLMPGGKLLGFLGSLATNYIDFNTDRDEFDDWSEGDGDDGLAMAGGRVPRYMSSTAPTHYVYVQRAGDHPHGRVEYVGISNDTDRRAGEHGRRCFRICDRKFSEREARSIESALMTRFPGAKRAGSPANVQIRRPGLRNRRLSVGRRHHFFMSALQDGIGLLREYAPDILQQIP
jgi:hypothetical protein